jgi:hypothetical protein
MVFGKGEEVGETGFAAEVSFSGWEVFSRSAGGASNLDPRDGYNSVGRGLDLLGGLATWSVAGNVFFVHFVERFRYGR